VEDHLSEPEERSDGHGVILARWCCRVLWGAAGVVLVVVGSGCGQCMAVQAYMHIAVKKAVWGLRGGVGIVWPLKHTDSSKEVSVYCS
jgi:hypothetical protein